MKAILYILLIVLFSGNAPIEISGKYELFYNPKISHKTDRDYTLNFDDKSYTIKIGNGSLGKGNFKIFEVDDKKQLLVIDDKIFVPKKNTPDIDVEYLGNTLFEISKKNKDTLIFKQTYSQNPQKIISSGIFVKLK